MFRITEPTPKPTLINWPLLRAKVESYLTTALAIAMLTCGVAYWVLVAGWLTHILSGAISMWKAH